MPTYDSLVDRDDADALIPEEVASEVIKGAVEQSAAMSLFRRVTMGRAQQRLPVVSVLPTAYFVSGDTGLKQTTEQNWDNKYLNAEEVAAIIPIPDAVLDDSDFDLWAEIRPSLEEAIGRAVDAAIFFGTNAPASWPDDIVSAATAASNTASIGDNTAAEGGLAGDLSDGFSTVEADGFDVNGLVAARSLKGALRQARGTTGERFGEIGPNAFDGVDITYPMRGLWPTSASSAQAVGGDFSQGIVGIRKDMAFEIFREGVVQDGSGAIVYNLLQQDMKVMRVTFRVAFQVPNPVNHDQGDEAERYPFFVLLSEAS